jgi:SnoaL-like domain
VVDDDAQGASGSWYFFEPCTMNGEAKWVIGAYEDRYRVDSDGRWRFAEVVLKSSVTAPYQSGWPV